MCFNTDAHPRIMNWKQFAVIFMTGSFRRPRTFGRRHPPCLARVSFASAAGPSAEKRGRANGRQFLCASTDVAILWEPAMRRRRRKCASPAKKAAPSAEVQFQQRSGGIHRSSMRFTEMHECSLSGSGLIVLTAGKHSLPLLRLQCGLYLRDWLVRHFLVCVCVWQPVTDGRSWLQAALARSCHTRSDSQLCYGDR